LLPRLPEGVYSSDGAYIRNPRLSDSVCTTVAVILGALDFQKVSSNPRPPEGV
jgi:hypothetical protein